MLVGNNANEIALFMVILNQVSALSSPLLSIANGAFSCPSGTAAQARTNAGVKAYRYLYAGEWPNQEIAPKAGAWHGSEIGMVFGSVEYQQQFFGDMIGQRISYPNTEAQKVLEKKMMSAWAAFAKDPDNALTKIGWPTYDEKKASIIQLGAPNSGNISFIDPAVVDKSCGLLDTMMSSMGGAGGLSGLTGLLGGLGKAPGGAGLPKGMGSSAPPGPVPGTNQGGVWKRGLGSAVRRKYYRGRRIAA
jgi:cholinesterase